jgi:hypothetical protein
MHIGLKGTMNALFLENLRFKTRRGQVGRAKAGRIPGGRLYGYDVVKGEEHGLRTINEPQAEIVRRIFREYVAGASPMAIVKRLNAEGAPSPSGKRVHIDRLAQARERHAEQSAVLGPAGVHAPVLREEPSHGQAAGEGERAGAAGYR